LQIAQWLRKTFNLTVDDIKAHNNYALNRSLRNHHLHVVQWLHDKIGSV